LLNIELKKAIPNAKGFNHQNLRYAEKFYTKYKKIFPQVVGDLKITDNIIMAAKKSNAFKYFHKLWNN